MAEYINVVNQTYYHLATQPIIFPRFKVELLDHSEKSVIKEITNDLVEGSGSISINYQQGTRRSCSFSVFNYTGEYSPSPLTGIFWIGSKFKIYVGLEDSSGNDIYWFSQGIYYVSNPTNSNDFENKIVNITGVDKFGVFGSDLGYNQLTGTYQFQANQKIYTIIEDILMLDMGNGNVIDPIPPIFDSVYKDEVLPYNLSKAAGQYLSDILIELGNILGANIFYDRNGVLNVQSGTTDIAYSFDSAIWNFSDDELEYLSNNISLDYTNTINSITVIGNNINDTIYSYTAENHNPLSPTRIEYIGRKELAPIETSVVYSEQSAKEYAEFELNRYSILQTTIGFECSLLPHLEVDKICNISDRYYDYDEERFIIQSITIPMGISGNCSVSASNIASLPYYELLVGG